MGGEFAFLTVVLSEKKIQMEFLKKIKGVN